jgi:hypothetical protein
MTPIDISNLRLINQQLATRKYQNVRDIANWMGAIQAQDFPMSKWAVGQRLNGAADNLIQKAFDNGEILRTHLLRPTLHLVSAENIRWLLNLTAPEIRKRSKTRHTELGLTESLLKKSNRIIKDSLKGENHLNREELVSILAKAGIPVNAQRAYHILVVSELDGITCSGRMKNGKQTFALLDERVPQTDDLTKEQSLGRVTGIYFSSRGPATLQDFIWWSGLSATDAKNALEIVKPGLISEKNGSEIYWFQNSQAYPGNIDESVLLLPAFDEFLICYRDRTASVPVKYHKKTISSNGIFWPVIVINGQVRGLWRRTLKKDKVTVEIRLFEPVNKTIINKISKQIELFGLFLNKKTESNLTFS